MQTTVREVLSGETLVVHFDQTRAYLKPVGSIPHEHLYLSPGWVDIQVNGFAGYDMNSAQLRPEHVAGMVSRLGAEGVALVYPTVVTASAEHITACLRTIATACETLPEVRAAVPGIHLEGPYLSPADGTRGVHPARHIHAPDWDEFSRWQEVAGGRIRLVTLAPEQPGSVDFIKRLVRADVAVALGHTQASTAELAAAADAGARLSTHLGNGIALTIRRHPNPILDQLADDRLYASLIFDGFHLPPNTMRVFLRAKGVERSILTSDAVALARQPAGVYDSPVGGRVELHPTGRLTQYGTEYLAGSASSLKDGVENAVRLAGCTLAQAVQMVTVTPRRGVPASLPETATLFHWEAGQQTATILATLVAGRVVYRAVELQPFLGEDEP